VKERSVTDYTTWEFFVENTVALYGVVALFKFFTRKTEKKKGLLVFYRIKNTYLISPSMYTPERIGTMSQLFVGVPSKIK
jgi:hypothetical protein